MMQEEFDFERSLIGLLTLINLRLDFKFLFIVIWAHGA